MTGSAIAASPRFRELDVVRVLTFACVVAVHVIGQTARGDIPLIGALVLLHFTREVFFALSSFVLVYSYLRRPQPMRRFWPRRFLYVGAPYVVWSAIYVFLNWARATTPEPLAPLLGDFGWALLTGKAFYHMYFLLVTMQMYLLFPLLVRLVVASRRHHVLVLIVALALQVTKSAIDAYRPGTLAWINGVSSVLNYQAFIIGGAIAADHASAVIGWARRNRRRIGLVVVIAAGTTVSVYLIQVFVVGFGAFRAATAYQPVVILWSAVVSVGLLAVGTWWVDRRGPDADYGRLDYLSDRSFGVFLAHPLVLWFVLELVGSRRDGWPVTLVAVLVYAVVASGALLVADLARRSPLSLVLAGRPWRAGRRTVVRS